MARIFEITTLAGRLQSYEVIRVAPNTFPNGNPCLAIEHLNRGKKSNCLDELASHAHSAYELTGLDEAIKQYPPNVVTEHDGEEFKGAEIARPERLRLIYDALPVGVSTPILRIYPIEGEQIYVAEYDLKKARLPLEKITFSQEFEGSLHMRFTGLQVFLHLRNFEKETEHYYEGDLKKSRARE
jgi:hypothetical protein